VIGAGFAEIVYERALCLELAARGIAFERQAIVRVDYKGHFVGEGWMDLLVERELIVELKAVPALLPRHAAQVLAYLKATHLRVGLLVNFDAPRLQIKRFIQSAQSPPSP
jgi:GxxExxY protein